MRDNREGGYARISADSPLFVDRGLRFSKDEVNMKKLLAILKEMTGAPGEFQVLPEGKIEIEGMNPAFLDEAAAGGVIAAFKARGNHMVVDYEHQTLTDGPAPAAGWIKDLIWKGKEGLWAAVEWTKKAKEHLENREYRYFSPVMLVGAKDGRVVKLINIALTNSPKINHLQPIVAKYQDHPEKWSGIIDECQRRVNELMGIKDEAFLAYLCKEEKKDPTIDETQRRANELMGVDDAMFRKYNK